MNGHVIPHQSKKLIQIGITTLPRTITKEGERASKRFVEFFTANIRNKNTRLAYARAVRAFFNWCDHRGLTLDDIEPTTVAAWIEELGLSHSAPSVKQHLAAIRMLFDWLVVGQVLPTNPAHSVRGPKHIVHRGKTPILSEAEARHLLASIDTSHVVGLRDRALIGTMLFSLARVQAAVSMNVEDYYTQKRRSWLRLHEKGGKFHEMPAHHKLEVYLDTYIEAAGIATNKKGPLFRTAIRKKKKKLLTENRMTRKDAWRMIRRRAKDAGIKTPIGCHSFRATGITNYLEHDGTLEKAQQMAAHSSARTTKLYDRRSDEVTLDEIERIAI
jgi:integrase/recombinase XerD